MTFPLEAAIPAALLAGTTIALIKVAASFRQASARNREREARLNQIRLEFKFIEQRHAQTRAEGIAALNAGDVDGYLKARHRAAILMRRLDREVNAELAKLP